MNVSSEIILLGDGTVFATSRARNCEDDTFVGSFFNLCACSETQLQLSLQLNVVGKKLFEV